jgi:hypothetical protein
MGEELKISEELLDAVMNGYPLFIDDDLYGYKKLVVYSKRIEFLHDKISISYSYHLSEKKYDYDEVYMAMKEYVEKWWKEHDWEYYQQWKRKQRRKKSVQFTQE